MPTLVFSFPGRRYHATPWGHHVNEGLIEWPPSPWRLLRTLLSVGYTRLGWNAGMAEPWRSQPPEAACRLLLKLADTLPQYALPPALGGHSRHYMPVAVFKGDREHTTLVFDTWAQVDAGEMAVHWAVTLDANETQLLAELAAHIGYLGRAESWVVARLACESEAGQVQINSWPCDHGTSPGPGWEQVSLLACEPEGSYAAWRAQRVDATLASLPPIAMPDKAKPTAKDRKAAELRSAERERAREPYPPDLMACLQTDTTWQRSHGWSQPPASRRVLYWRRADALRAAAMPPTGARAHGSHASVPFVLMSLATPSGNNNALPPLARGLPQGERLHSQLVGAQQRLAPGVPAPVLTGCDEHHQPLRGAHGHTHVLPLDLDGDGRIDHFLLWAPSGLRAEDQQAIRHVRKTHVKGLPDPLRLSWAAAGAHPDLQRLRPPWGEALQSTVGCARCWVSATPFVPPRHLKPRGVNSLEGQIRAELLSRQMPLPTTVELLDPPTHASVRALRHHIRVRGHGPRPPIDVGLAVRMTFAEDVTGPICLGYASHFGLGRFERVRPA